MGILVAFESFLVGQMFVVLRLLAITKLSPLLSKTVSLLGSLLWDHLSSLRGNINGPWILLGDFNEVLHASEVYGGNFGPS